MVSDSLRCSIRNDGKLLSGGSIGNWNHSGVVRRLRHSVFEVNDVRTVTSCLFFFCLSVFQLSFVFSDRARYEQLIDLIFVTTNLGKYIHD